MLTIPLPVPLSEVKQQCPYSTFEIHFDTFDVLIFFGAPHQYNYGAFVFCHSLSSRSSHSYTMLSENRV
jgi:hypothetical protein